MDTVNSDKKIIVSRISEIVENLFQTEIFYQEELGEPEMIQLLVTLFGKFSPEELRAIDDEELTKRIDSILALEATAGMLNDLTPEQMEIFDAAVAGK